MNHNTQFPQWYYRFKQKSQKFADYIYKRIYVVDECREKSRDSGQKMRKNLFKKLYNTI